MYSSTTAICRQKGSIVQNGFCHISGFELGIDWWQRGQQLGRPILLQVNPEDCAHLERREQRWRMRQHQVWQPEPCSWPVSACNPSCLAHLPLL